MGAARLAIVSSLLAHNASVNETMARLVSYNDHSGSTPLHLAAEQTTYASEIIGVMIDHIQATAGAEGIRAALEATTKKGHTPMQMAESGGAIDALVAAQARGQVVGEPPEGSSARSQALDLINQSILEGTLMGAHEKLKRCLDVPRVYNKEGKPEASLILSYLISSYLILSYLILSYLTTRKASLRLAYALSSRASRA